MSLSVTHAICSPAFAGVERYVAVLAAAQADLGYHVTVIGGDPALMPSAIARPNVRFLPGATLPETSRAINAERSCDILNVHMTAAETAALLARRARKIPMIATRHFAAIRGSSPLGALIRPMVQKRLAAQIAVSQFVAERIDGRSWVICPGVATPPASPPHPRLSRTIMLAQRLQPEKGTEVALKAFALSRLAVLGWRLVIAGEGSNLPWLTRLGEELGVSKNIDFLGFRSDVSALMCQAAIFLAPAPSEHFGLSVVEAMAVGLPVVATASGGHLETVGLAAHPALFSPGDSVGAASLLRALAQDVERREEYGAELQSIQRTHFTPSAHARAVEAVYRSTL